MSASKLTPAQQRMQRIVEHAIALGYIPDGETMSETVRMWSADPQGWGKREVTSGGRTRLALPNSSERITIGPRTICIYRLDKTNRQQFSRAIVGGHRTYTGDGTSEMLCIDTRDVDDALAAISLRVAATSTSSVDHVAADGDGSGACA